MKRYSGIVALTVALSVSAGALPALAQYANEFTPAKLVRQGTTTHDIAGSGKVIVQVQVNADGSHKVVKIISSTNPGDNAAAMEIAQSSTYRPAHKGTTATAAFYDFTLRFNGKSVAQTDTGGEMSSSAAAVAALIRQKNYAEAKSRAQAGLASSPDDATLREMLGVAAYNSGDEATAAQAFDKVPTIGKQFQPAAASAFASAAVKLADTDPALALTYAQKAYAIDPNTNSRFALGVAQLANKQNAEALTTLKAAHESAIRDSSLNAQAKSNIDAQLMTAYLANNDPAGAQALAAEIKQLDPSSPVAARVMGNTYLRTGIDDANAKNYTEAIVQFDKAAQQGDTQVSVTAYTQAAFAYAKMPKPDFKTMQSYADKALALEPNNPEANFAEGISLTGQWVAAQTDAAAKKKALDALNKADALAKQANNTALVAAIESFIKQSNIAATPAK
jgi:hypothetical protein